MLTRLRQGSILVCNVCRKTFANRKDFDDHGSCHDVKKPKLKRSKSNDNSINGIVKQPKASLEEALFLCNHCWKQFKGLDQLQQHLKIHVGRVNQRRHPISKNSLESLFMCGICSTFFNTNAELQAHFQIHVKDYEKGKKPHKKKCNAVAAPSRSILKVNQVIEQEIETETPESLPRVKAEPPDGDSVTEQSVFVCEQCHDFFTTYEELEAHEKLHIVPEENFSSATVKIEEESFFVCKLCQPSVAFATDKELQEHMVSHVQGFGHPALVIKADDSDTLQSSYFLCKLCGSESTLYSELEFCSHLQMHAQGEAISDGIVKQECEVDAASLEPSFTCVPCGTFYSTNKELQDHLKVHASVSDPLLVEVKSVSSDPEVCVPSSEMSVFMCEPCGVLFANNEDLQQHFQMHEQQEGYKMSENVIDVDENRANTKDDSVFMCDPCKTFFTTNEEFLAHLKIHSCDDNASSAIIEKLQDRTSDVATSEEPIFMCGLCSSFFPSNDELQTHFLIHTCDGNKDAPVPKEQSEYVCGVCDEAFPNTNSLRPHVSKHLQGSTYICKICGKDFKTSNSLGSHITYLHKEKTFVCKECSKSFTSEASLERHLLTHIAMKHYMCQYCGKTYNEFTVLRSHLKRDHNADYMKEDPLNKKKFLQLNELVPCHVCRNMISFENLQNHLSKIHGIGPNVMKPK